VTAVIAAIEHEMLSRKSESKAPRIWAGDVMRFRGRSFTHLFVVRMQDDVFPQRRTEDPLLPDPDRRLLHLREIGDGREEEQLLFSLLGDASPNVYFSFATGDGFGKVLRPSRYLRNAHVTQVITPHPPSAPSPLTRGEGYSMEDLARSTNGLAGSSTGLAKPPQKVAFSLSQPHRDGEKVAKPDEGRSRSTCADFPRPLPTAYCF